MTVVATLGQFVAARSWDDLADVARRELKIRVLDSIGALGRSTADSWEAAHV